MKLRVTEKLCLMDLSNFQIYIYVYYIYIYKVLEVLSKFKRTQICWPKSELLKNKNFKSLKDFSELELTREK